jgi:hypothetical protein
MSLQSKKKLFVIIIAVFAAIAVGRPVARADIVWQDVAAENNYVPFGEDGTPGRPVPGDVLGTTITLDGTNRTLDRITVAVALNNAAMMPLPTTDTWTVTLYLNDGPTDDKSGLGQPGTAFASASTDVAMPPFSQNVVFDFSGAGVVVPDSFTVAIGSSHSTDTFFQPAGVPGPFSTTAAPTVGSGVNTLWYTDTDLGWVTNSTWAIADGATTNYLNMTVEASP